MTIIHRPLTKEYAENYDRIFKKEIDLSEERQNQRKKQGYYIGKDGEVKKADSVDNAWMQAVHETAECPTEFKPFINEGK